MNLKKLIYILLSLLYLDLIFNLFSYNSYLFSSVINIFLFDLVLGVLIHIITSLFSEKVNKIITYIIFVFLWFWYSLYYVFYKVLITPFSISLFRQTDQVLKFGKNVIISIIQNIHVLLFFFLPVIIIIILRNKIRFNKAKIKNILIYIVVFLMTIGIYVGNIFVQGRGVGSAYNLYYETRNTSLNIQRLGVMSATYLDIKRALFGFDEKIEVVKQEIIEDEVNVEYDYNKQDFDFDGGSGNIQIINNFMDSEIGTKQNDYTGKFKGKNLIFIVAESFSEIGVSQEYTPTLYKLVHEGFDFENFYTSNNLSTIGGEFQALTGLYADNSILTEWRGGKNYFPYGLANVFKNLGYSTYAYHDNSAYFQDRNVYLKSQGFDNFKGCYNGLEKDINCNQWPQSDVEMMDATVSDYIDSDEPFMVYYMTVSGHFYYNFSENSIAKKNKSLVEDLDYPEEVKGYIATQIELDRAVETLMNRLEEAGKLDDTVIVLLGDHYPYNLPIDYINLLSTYKRDSLIEANSNNLILYNKSIESVKVDKVGMSIDVLPTVLNLFGVDYDSRLIMGKDILSSAEGIAIFKDKSWVTNKGTYHASTGIFDAKEEVSDDYIDTINNIVNNRVAISRMIVSNNYYKYLFEK
jgi:phosphoglycerol transferase MdoB-like AlkP superfamily enzyme